MANYQYINETGTINPDTSTLLQEVQDEYRAVFGNDVDVSGSTPLGVWIAAEVEARSNVLTNNAVVANQINPNLSGGVFLDAVSGLTGLERGKETRTTVTANLAGVPGTIVPAGSQARTATGQVFESLSAAVLVAGTVAVEFRAIEYGPVEVEAGQLNQIVAGGVLGWETITNPAAGVLGSSTQADFPFRNLRNETVGIQGVALPTAIYGTVRNVEGVRSLTFRENEKKFDQTIDGVLIDANSIFVCVDGGSDLDVATAILDKKGLGTGYTGTTTVPVVDPTTGQTYDVKFQRPTEVTILMQITVQPTGSVTNPEQAVIDAVLAYVNGSIPGEPGFVVGGDVSPFEIGAAVNSFYPQFYVKRVEISRDTIPPAFSTDDIPIGINEVARTDNGNITVVVLT